MGGASDISIPALGIYLFLFAIPMVLMDRLNLPMKRALLIAIIRMVVQLCLVGLYLGIIFQWDHLGVNLAWVVIMIMVANASILNQGGLSFRRMFFVTLPALVITMVLITASLLLVFDVDELMRARYFIPLQGMILGNILKANVVVLDRFYSDLIRREAVYIQNLSLGASRIEALVPFAADALRAAMAPQMATLSTIGLVALPGMMTGQILGGSSPEVAIQYQILILTAIFVAMSVSALLVLYFSQLGAFDAMGRLRKDFFRSV